MCVPTLGEGLPRSDVVHGLVAVEVELALLRLMLGMKVPGLMLLVVHPDDDAKEDRDDRHAASIASSPRAVAPTSAEFSEWRDPDPRNVRSGWFFDQRSNVSTEPRNAITD